MSPLLTEKLIFLREAAGFFPARNGKKPHLSAVYRWATSGSKGVILETVIAPGGRCTSREAVQRFLAQLTEATTGKPSGLADDSQTRRIAAAEKALAKAGA